jgi:5-methylcytosine-specific restriction enzyme A
MPRPHDAAYEARRLARSPWRRFYATKAWQGLRQWRLQRDPLCVMCAEQGNVVPASVVDHLRPHQGDWALFIDADNTQSLCVSHHNSSKQREEHAGGAIGCAADGSPRDPGHHWHK